MVDSSSFLRHCVFKMVSLKELRGSHLRMLMTIVCGCAFSLFGYDQALYGGVASGEAFLRQFNHPSSSLTGQIAALFDIGCLVGAVSSTIITHRMGYKKTLVSFESDSVSSSVAQTKTCGVGLILYHVLVPGFRHTGHWCNYTNCLNERRDVNLWPHNRWCW